MNNLIKIVFNWNEQNSLIKTIKFYVLYIPYIFKWTYQ